MRKLLILLFIISGRLTLPAQNWTSQTISPSGSSIVDIYFTDTNTGYGVGKSGIILKTTNGGSSWTQQTSGTTNNLKKVYFTSSNVGYTIGASGTILKTLNGGTSWIQQTSGTTKGLDNIKFIDEKIGYAVGYAGIILKTVNGGSTWTKTNSPSSSHSLTSSYFVDENIGYVASSFTIFKTTDGGITWTKTTIEDTPKSVRFTDSKNGFFVSYVARIFRTNDGGTTWYLQKDQDTYIFDAFNDVNFIDDNIGYVVGAYDYRFDCSSILKTINGGKTWIKQTNEGEQNLLAVRFPSPSVGYILGENGLLLKTVLNPELNLSTNALEIDALANSYQTFEVNSTTTWTATSDQNWLTLSSNSGSNNMILTATASENTATRTATISITTDKITQTILVTQLAPFTELKQSSVNSGYKSSVENFTINSNTNWTITDIPNWVTLSQTSGFGYTIITVNIAANNALTSRSASLKISAARTSNYYISIYQDAFSYSLAVNPPAINNNNSAASIQTFNIIANADWTITNIPNWIQLSSISGSGNAIITATFDENTSYSQRTQYIHFSEGTINTDIFFSQKEVIPYMELSNDYLTFVSTNSTSKEFRINTNTAWTISNIPSWLTFSTTKGSNSETITITALNNDNLSRRAEYIYVYANAGSIQKCITVVQNAYGVDLNVSTNTLNFDQLGGNQIVIINTNTTWDINCSSWIKLEKIQDENAVLVSVDENTNPSARTGTVVVYGDNVATQYITIIQNGTLTDVSEKETEKNRIYPNPTKNILRIDGLNNEIQVEVLDLTGRTILSSQTTNHQIDVSVLKSGMYILKIETKKGSITKKFIKE